jgi:hypothetical protein
MENDRIFLKDLIIAAVNGKGKKLQKSIVEFVCRNNIGFMYNEG